MDSLNADHTLSMSRSSLDRWKFNRLLESRELHEHFVCYGRLLPSQYTIDGKRIYAGVDRIMMNTIYVLPVCRSVQRFGSTVLN